MAKSSRATKRKNSAYRITDPRWPLPKKIFVIISMVIMGSVIALAIVAMIIKYFRLVSKMF